MSRGRAVRVPRWLTLRYAAQCKVCGRTVAAGEVAFYDYIERTATCSSMECCAADGLTRQEWAGSPISGQWATVRASHRIGAGFVRDPGEDAADRWSETH